MRSDPDFYAILQLAPGSSLEDIKRQYRRLAKIYHPDRNNNAEWCQEQSKQLNLAYEYLLDPARKAAYDARFRPVLAAARPPAMKAERTAPRFWPPPQPPLPAGTARPASFAGSSPGSFPGQTLRGGSLSLLRWALFGKVGPALVLGLAVAVVLWLSWDGGFSDSAGAGDRIIKISSRHLPAATDDLPVTEPPQPASPADVPQSADNMLPDNGVPPSDDPVDTAYPPLPDVPSVGPLPTSSPAHIPPAALPARFQAVLSGVDALLAEGDDAVMINAAEHGAAVRRLGRDLEILRSRRSRVAADLVVLEDGSLSQDQQSRAKTRQAALAAKGDFQNLEASLSPARADLGALKAAQNSVAVAPPPPSDIARTASLRRPVPAVHVAVAPVRVAVVSRAAPPVLSPPKSSSMPKATPSPHLTTSGSDEAQFSVPGDAGNGSPGRAGAAP